MKKSLKEIAELLNGELTGDGNIEIIGFNGIKEACQGELTFLAHPLYKPLINTTQASAIIVSKDIDFTSKPVIKVDDPSAAFTKVIALFDEKPKIAMPAGIHKTAVIGKNAVIGKDAAIGAFVVIDDFSDIGDSAVIYPHVYIGNNVKIGNGVILYPNVSIRENCVIGSGVIIHSGSVIGSDGFGYVQVKGSYKKIPQTGIVYIGDDVEIGSNVSIDRARFGRTSIGRGCKIDNLVQIAHNVVIGENSIIVSQAGISGSSRIGNNAILAGQSGIVGHIELGDNVIVGAQAGVTKSVPSNTVVLGSPANIMSEQKRIFACLNKLPGLFKAVRELAQKQK